MLFSCLWLPSVVLAFESGRTEGELSEETHEGGEPSEI